MLFDEYILGPLRLRNRMVRAATFEKRADEDGRVTEEIVALYSELARGGAGLIITGAALVHPSGRYLRKMLSAHSDIYTDGLGRIASAVHSGGGLIALQIDHGGRQCSPLLLGGEPPMAPSAVHDPATDATPRPMDDREIWEAIDAFASAAFRARSAGFDAVEIQASRGYLISSFLSPHTNLRDDYWGGDSLRRTHMLEETLRAIRKAAGDDFPVIVKLNVSDHVRDGITPRQSIDAALVCQEEGAVAVELTGGMRESSKHDLPDSPIEGYYRTEGRMFSERLSIPVILTGGFRSLSAMEDALCSGEADLIGLSRPLIMEPDLPERLMKGQQKAGCDSCSECLRLSRAKEVTCPKA